MKYRLTDETKEFYGRILHRIEAIETFGNVEAGEKGGWVEKEENLSQEGLCWVYGNAQVCCDAHVYGDAWVYGDAQVYDNAWVYGDAQVRGNAQVYGDARVCGDARVYDNAQVYGDAQIRSHGDIFWIAGLGSRHGTTTIYRNKDGGLTVSCGCFLGTLEEFEAKVKETHGDNLFGREYRALIELAKIHFEVNS